MRPLLIPMLVFILMDASIQAQPAGPASVHVKTASWQQGVRNILFVIDHVARTRPDVDASRVLLVGHSHGGATSVLLARDRPSQVSAVITLDNRRMPFPRTATLKVLTLRSSDQPADEGVLPTPAEQSTLGMSVVRLPATIHNDMWDGATAAQKAEMLGHIERFLRGLS